MNELKKEDQSAIHNIIKNMDKLVIEDLDGINVAGGYLVYAKLYIKTIEAHYKPLKDAAYKAHKAITTQEKADLSVIEVAANLLAKKRSAWKTEQDRIEREEQDRLEAEERERAKAEQDRLLQEAVDSEDQDEAEEKLEESEKVYAKPVYVEKKVEKTSHIGNSGATSTWIEDVKIEVTDIKALCQAVWTGQVPVTCVEFKPGKLKTFVKSMGIEPGQIKGLQIEETQRESIRG